VADANDCQTLIDGYRFLRQLEHRIRIVHDRSEHRLPREPVELDKLAARMRYRDRAALMDHYRQRTEDNRAAYRRLVAG
jgi:[glutamine synthetase] adenylyltransferase / [glutamine synthetase]-adenylyl-L-tyrosine phosphorylase